MMNSLLSGDLIDWALYYQACLKRFQNFGDPATVVIIDIPYSKTKSNPDMQRKSKKKVGNVIDSVAFDIRTQMANQDQLT